ncbi:MAG: hypothetical protein JWP87_927 [Labilithrix sp.]|jgi:hypothetical protein|nr:hypothetical protein [Labilithrix sp.]
MQRAVRYRVVSIVLCAVLGGFVALSACSNYEEGDRCEVLNGNDDCASPLQCTPKGLIAQGFNNSDRCCPVDRSTATADACKQPQVIIGGDATPPDGSTGPLPEASIDAPVETSTIPEAGPDVDASDDGG